MGLSLAPRSKNMGEGFGDPRLALYIKLLQQIEHLFASSTHPKLYTFSCFFQPCPATKASTTTARAPAPAKLDPARIALLVPNKTMSPRPRINMNLFRTFEPLFCMGRTHGYQKSINTTGILNVATKPEFLINASYISHMFDPCKKGPT